jgi:hypothetical protein
MAIKLATTQVTELFPSWKRLEIPVGKNTFASILNGVSVPLKGCTCEIHLRE